MNSNNCQVTEQIYRKEAKYLAILTILRYTNDE